MGNKDRKKGKSRSRSRERDKYKSRERRHSSSRSRSSSSEPRSRHQKSKKKHHSSSKHSRRSHSRSKSRSPEQLIPTAMELEIIREEQRKKKDDMKKFETPEEKRARRLAKKEGKERKRKAKMGWDEEYMGYTNADNPFGDEHLLQTFVWSKKLQKEGVTDLDSHNIDKMQKRKMMENKIELEKVKKRRLEREREREERENEKEMLQRNKEVEYYRVWEQQEDTFHLNQARLRSKIRIDDGRAKPIDLLARYIAVEDDEDVTIEMHEPYTYLNGMTVNDLEDLLEDIKVYMEMELDSKNLEFWKDITIITEDELSKLRKLDTNSKDHVGERRSGINESVLDDVAGVFKGKTLHQLSILEISIKTKLKGGEGIDVGYWESLLNQLKAHMARSRLREKHQEQLRRKLFKLKQQQGIESSTPLFPIMKSEQRKNSPKPDGNDKDTATIKQESEKTIKSETNETAEEVAGPSGCNKSPSPQPGTSKQDSSVKEEVTQSDDDEPLITEADLEEELATQKETSPEEKCSEDYLAGSYSPRLLPAGDLEADALVYDPTEDMQRLQFARRQVLKTGLAKKDGDDDLLKIAKAGMNEEEASFSVMVPLEKQTMAWSDKYKPRKPRFFNRVHTGFEWNKYNQTHYDMDNPPPKIVQGYKFNIFYPDLIDKSKAPSYTITPIEQEDGFAILRFVAGPPYEDIAFKIANREWEYSYKRGFRCQFQNNIFQLWFHFKRFRYRR